MATSCDMRVLVVDGDPLTLRGLAASLADLQGCTVCGAVDSAQAAWAVFENGPVQFLVMEYPLPADDGLALIHDFLNVQPTAHAVVIVNRDDRVVLERLFTVGARAIVHRSDAPGALAAAFAAAKEGRRFLSPHATQSMLASMAHKSNGKRTGDAALLSNREFEVFAAIAHKQGPKAIAQRLGVAVKTVETHKGKIKEKLGIKTAAELQKRADRWLAA